MTLTWQRAKVTIPIVAATMTPWLIVSLLMFGTVFPDTLIWKQSQNEGLGGYMFGDAVLLFLRVWPAATVVALAAGFAALVTVAYSRAWLLAHRSIILLVVGAVGHLLTLCALDVAPYPWYPAPAAGAGIIVLALAASLPSLRRRRSGITTCCVLIAAGVVVSAAHDYQGRGSPYNYNRATPAQYTSVAARAPSGAVVATADEVGALAFFLR